MYNTDLQLTPWQKSSVGIVFVKAVFMKRKILLPAILFIAMLGSATLAAAQNPVFTRGTVTANLGVGVGTNYNHSRSALGTKAALEFGIWQAGPGVISLGAEVGGTFSSKSKYDDWNDYRARTIIAAGRSAWHSGWGVRNLDTYAGVSAGVGFRHTDYNDRNNHFDDDDVIPVFGAFIGASYFISPSFGVNV